MFHHPHQLLFSFLAINQVLVLRYDREPFLKLSLSVLLAHMFRKLCEITSVQVDHLILLLLVTVLFILVLDSRLGFLAADLVVSVFILAAMLAQTHLATLVISGSFVSTSLGNVLLELGNVTHIGVIEEIFVLILIIVSGGRLVLIYVHIFELLSGFLLVLLFPDLSKNLVLDFLLSLPFFLFPLFFCFSLLFFLFLIHS